MNKIAIGIILVLVSCGVTEPVPIEAEPNIQSMDNSWVAMPPQPKPLGLSVRTSESVSKDGGYLLRGYLNSPEYLMVRVIFVNNRPEGDIITTIRRSIIASQIIRFQGTSIITIETPIRPVNWGILIVEEDKNAKQYHMP